MKKILLCTIMLLSTALAFSKINEILASKTHFQDLVSQNAFQNFDKEPLVNETERLLSSTYRDENGYRVVEEKIQHWTGIDWVNFRKTTYSYYPDGLFFEGLREDWNGTNWEFELRSQSFYNENGNLTERLSEYYEDNSWINNSLLSITYDENDLEIESIYQDWIDSEWVNCSRMTYTNYEGNCIEELNEFWEENQWNYCCQVYYSYDDNNNVIEVIDEFWENNEWVYNIKDSYTYNDEDILQYRIREVWNNNIWNLGTKTIYSYDDFFNLIEKLEQCWNNVWIDDSINSFLYDENQNQIEWLYQSYISGQLTNWFRYTNTFDENNNEIISIRENWENEQWVYYTRTLYTYEQYTELTEFILSEIQSSNYPNPFNPTTTISFSIPEENPVIISIFNVKGQKIKTITNEIYSKGEHSIIWNGNNDSNVAVSSGIYFYKIEINGKTKGLKKMLLLK